MEESSSVNLEECSTTAYTLCFSCTNNHYCDLTCLNRVGMFQTLCYFEDSAEEEEEK